MPSITPPRPEFAVEHLRRLLEICRIHKRRGFQDIPAHDAIVLALLNTGAMFKWTLTCQIQFESVKNAFNFNFAPTMHVPQGVPNTPLAPGVPHQQSTSISTAPSRPHCHRPLRHQRGQPSSNSVRAQVVLVRASSPYRMHRPRIFSTLQQLLAGGFAGLEYPVHGPLNPRCTLQQAPHQWCFISSVEARYKYC